jgi:hypothetical protein
LIIVERSFARPELLKAGQDFRRAFLADVDADVGIEQAASSATSALLGP